MDSSPDLSLKLRRGSSDSRDTFYMDFAQGIDSDIEEVDNSAIKREPQQTPTPPPPIADEIDMSLPSASLFPPPPLASMLQHQTLPTLREQDDLPPSPPLEQYKGDNVTGSIDLASPPVSPTTSVLKIIPPPPLPLSPQLPAVETKRHSQPFLAEEYNEEDEISTPPPPLLPLPETFSYMHGSEGASSHINKSPSTSPSPPITPPPCTQMICLDKIVSPLMSHEPPVTPPMETDQSLSGSPPPLPLHLDIRGSDDQKMFCPLPRTRSRPTMLSTPPPEYMGTDNMIVSAVAATLSSTSPDLIQEVVKAVGIDYQYGEEDIRSLNDDESTTITTPPTNGYSASSIVLPQGELEHDYGLNLADIPPPIDMESQNDDEEVDGDMEVEDEYTQEKTLTSVLPLSDVKTDVHSTADIPAEEAVPPSQSPTVVSASGSPQKSSVEKTDSLSASRSGNHSGIDNNESRHGSIKERSICTAAPPIASSASATPVVEPCSFEPSPQASIKSIKSQNSMKSTCSSKKSFPHIDGRIRSPSAGESHTSILSSSRARSTLVTSQSPIEFSSPTRLCSSSLQPKKAESIEKEDRTSTKTIK